MLLHFQIVCRLMQFARSHWFQLMSRGKLSLTKNQDCLGKSIIMIVLIPKYDYSQNYFRDISLIYIFGDYIMNKLLASTSIRKII